jgi:phosphatidylinositol alpha-1,6-mannosyltransferase
MRKVLFLNLATFSLNGGIEKFNRCFLKALSLIGKDDTISSYSMSVYDATADDKYFDNKHYKGFRKNKIIFILQSVVKSLSFDTIILGHINLALSGWLIKKIFPGKKVILVAHGIEVWEPLHGLKKKMVAQADKILAVSNFTKQQICSAQKVDGDNIVIFPNTIDPYFAIPDKFNVDRQLKEKYGLADNDTVLFTLARLSSAEQYKGYDIVLECLPAILLKYPATKYIIGGKYDAAEKERVDKIILDLNIGHAVIVAGFIKDEELVAHYQMADLFIMPSSKEGFGIVFIEAMVCGLPVMAGNIDGSVDALCNGELGTLVNPLIKTEIIDAVSNFLEHKDIVNADYKFNLQQNALKYFEFDVFAKRLKNILAA